MKALKYALCAALMGTPALADVPGVNETEIYLGAVLPMSGPVSFPGLGALAGARLAIAEVNAAGGLHGRTVRLRVEDDGYVPSRSYQGLVNLLDAGVLALVGTSGAAGLVAMLPLIDEQQVPTLVSTSVTSAAVNPVRPYIYMLGADYEDMFFAQMQYINENEQPQGPWAIISQDDDYGEHVVAGFTRAVETLDLPSVPPVRFMRGQRDFAAEILRLRTQDIGALVVGGVIMETPAVLRELARLQMPIPTAHAHTAAIDMTLGLAAPFNMTYYAADYVVPIGSDEAAGFRERASQFLSAEDQGNLNRFAITSYLGTRAVLVAAEACGRDLTRECLAEELGKIDALDTGGLSAPLDFTNDRHTAARAVQVVHVNPMANTVEPVTDFVSFD